MEGGKPEHLVTLRARRPGNPENLRIAHRKERYVNTRKRIFLAKIAYPVLLLILTACGQARKCSGLPDSGGTQPFNFAVIADPHIGETRIRAGYERYGGHLQGFLAAVRAMETLPANERPEFILVLGDIHMWALRKHLDRIGIRMYVIAGNHENTVERRDELRELFPNDFRVDGKPSDYYSFVHKGVRFVGICNAGAGGDHVGHLCSEIIRPAGQCDWIERELARPERTKIIFAHVPLEPEGRSRNNYLAQNDSRRLLDMIARYRPTAMFFGHHHPPETTEFAIGETKGFILRACSWNRKGAAPGFLLVGILPDGKVTTREILPGPPPDPAENRSTD